MYFERCGSPTRQLALTNTVSRRGELLLHRGELLLHRGKLLVHVRHMLRLCGELPL